MNFVNLSDRVLSARAQDLVDFDRDSIRQVIAGNHARQPTIWVADAELYEFNGRILRDSTSPRLLAYSPDDQILYATDGCNACIHRLATDLKNLDDGQIQALVDGSKIRRELVLQLTNLLSGS